MSLFSEIEKSIERGFRKWTERVFGPADSGELLLVHRAILEEIEAKVQILQRGTPVFPYRRVVVRLSSPEPDRRALYEAAFAHERRLEREVREALGAAGCTAPAGFTLEVETAADGPRPFAIEYSTEAPATLAADAQTGGRIVTVRGKTRSPEYPLEKRRVNLGRMEELTDADHRVIRRNDIVFEEGADEANSTVSRAHAHIDRNGGEYRIADDGSEYGTRIFREGKSIEVPAGNRRGERLRAGDEIYLGRACLRFEHAGEAAPSR